MRIILVSLLIIISAFVTSCNDDYHINCRFNSTSATIKKGDSVFYQDLVIGTVNEVIQTEVNISIAVLNFKYQNYRPTIKAKITVDDKKGIVFIDGEEGTKLKSGSTVQLSDDMFVISSEITDLVRNNIYLICGVGILVLFLVFILLKQFVSIFRLVITKIITGGAAWFITPSLQGFVSNIYHDYTGKVLHEPFYVTFFVLWVILIIIISLVSIGRSESSS